MIRIARRLFVSLFLLAPAFAASAQSRGGLEIDIVGGNAAALPIAVVPFGGETGETDVDDIIRADLARSGQFRTIAEAGLPGYEATSWFGMFAPAGTPAPVLAQLNKALVKVLNQADVAKKINEQGAETYSETPEQFAAFIQAESAKWGKVVKESGASLD